AFWPCVVLAGRRELWPPLRGLFLGSAGLLASLAVLGESRGWLFVTPVMVILAVVLVPGRGRVIVSMAAVAGAILLIRRPLLDVYEPKYPHSTELRPLSETGVVGGLLFFGALAAALVAAFPVLRRPGLAGAAGGSALLLFAYFMIHGSIDWLWEFAGLGGPAFAMLGI